MFNTSGNSSSNTVSNVLGMRSYEVSNHLEEHVKLVKTEMRTASSNCRRINFTNIFVKPLHYKTIPHPSTSSGVVDYYHVEIEQATDYTPFGMAMVGRDKQGITGYRYGYNGMEIDPEMKGKGNEYTTEFRQYDPRVGRWMSLDPLMMQFPWMSPYCAFDNNPLTLNDTLGLSTEDNDDWFKNEKTGEIQWVDDDAPEFVEINATEGNTVWNNIGKENDDIVKDLSGKTTFKAETYDWGITKVEQGPNYVVASYAKVTTTLTVSIRAYVTYSKDKRTFNGIDFFASTSGTTSATLTEDLAMSFTATKVKFNETAMKPLPKDGLMFHSPYGSGGYKYSWTTKRIYSDFNQSYNRCISIKGQYKFGGSPLLKPGIAGFLLPPNITEVSLTLPFNNK